MYQNTHRFIFSRKLRFLTASAFMLLFIMLISSKVQAANTKGVTVLSSNNSLGAVFCTHNGSSFTHYTYAEPTDSITVNAISVNKNYQFINWTDNGVVVSDKSTYSFTVNDKNHVVVAHFDSKPEMKHKRYDSDKDISSITHNTNACAFASEYKIDGMTINTALVPLDDASTAAIEASTGGHFLGAFQIQFTFGYSGTPKQSLDQTSRLVLQLPKQASGVCRISYVSAAGIDTLEDLDTNANTVTFSAKNSGLYVVTDGTNTMAAPAATTVPAAITAAPAAPVVSQEQYQEAIINILRYQLQQAGLTPAA